MQTLLIVALFASLSATTSDIRHGARLDFAITRQTAALATLQSPSVKVWVNLSSRVYYCPGTRYYGATKRGEFMAEADAEKTGSRPAYGRRCGPESSTSIPLSGSTSAATFHSSIASSKGTGSSAANAKVWVNKKSRVYHCPGTRYYGTTKSGEFMMESEAQASGNRPAYGRSCS